MSCSLEKTYSIIEPILDLGMILDDPKSSIITVNSITKLQ